MAQVIDVQVPPTMVAKVIAVSCWGVDGGNNSGQRRHSTVTNQIKIIAERHSIFSIHTPLTQLSFLTFQMLACWRGCSTDHWEKGGFYHEGAKRRTYACSINIKIIIFITDNRNNNFSCITLYLHNSTQLHLRDHLVAATTIDYSTTSGPPTLRLSSLHIFCCNLIFSFWTRPVCISL